MPDRIFLELPVDLANELITDGDARGPLVRRRGASEILSLVINSINTGSALVSVVAGVAAAKRVARAIARKADAESKGRAVITVTTDGRTHSHTYDAQADGAEKELEEFMRAHLGGRDDAA